MSGVRQIGQNDWGPRGKLEPVGVLEATEDELATRLGIEFDLLDDPNEPGPTAVALLETAAGSQFILRAARDHPAIEGVELFGAGDVSPATVRADFMATTGISPDAFLHVREGDAWFRRERD